MKLACRRGSDARSTARRRSGRRASTRSTMTRSSRRASWLPRQKWAPKPKATCGLGLRVMSKVSGSVEDGLVAVGRGVEEDELLAGLDVRARPARRRGWPTRAMFLIGDTQRSISSTAPGMQPGGVGGELRRLVGVGEELLHAAADDMAGGLVAADQDEQRLVDERVVVERVTVDLGMAQHADEVVGVAAGAAVLEDRVDVLGVLQRRRWPRCRSASGSGEPWPLSMSSDHRSRSSRSSGATPSMSPIMMMGSGAAMSLHEVAACPARRPCR